jgi:hypothetical protein
MAGLGWRHVTLPSASRGSPHETTHTCTVIPLWNESPKYEWHALGMLGKSSNGMKKCPQIENRIWGDTSTIKLKSCSMNRMNRMTVLCKNVQIVWRIIY